MSIGQSVILDMGDDMRNLKMLRMEKNMTQLSLQMQTGIDQAVISKYENGERVPTVENLLILAEHFQTSLDYLMDKTDQRKPYPRS